MREAEPPKAIRGGDGSHGRPRPASVAHPLASAPVTARLDPWFPIEDRGAHVLFGYSPWHEELGGLSWLLSSPVMEFDDHHLRARTRSGRVYELGRRISAAELPDDEARLVHCLLTGPGTWRGDPTPHADLYWLAALKVSRWLGAQAPARGDVDGLRKFLVTTRDAYRAAQVAAGVRPRW